MPNSTTHGFRLEREEHVDEINARARLYRHVKSGAQLLSLETDDENKVFGVSFRTVPADSTGVAHILEHAVLGGSRKYPLKEPFVQLIKGSLKTFLNAFTSPDKTTYPVASTNVQDFYNLVDVYLDAVFHPLITRHHLDQEGWHYELESADAPLAFRGVVFNEMKGVYSSPDALLYRAGQQALFPDTAYGHDSGGDPAAIPDLTYEQFTDFHRTYYHPSNARIFFYGDDDPEERLRLLDAYLRDFDAQSTNGLIDLQARLAEPRRVVLSYNADAEETGDARKNRYIMLNWLLPESGDQDLVMALSVLSYALISTQASPLRKVLTDSGLGEDVLGGGLSSHLRQMTFRAGMKGVAPEDVDKVEALILETLAQIAEDGFEPEMVEAAVNSIEFDLREANTGSYPRGLIYFMGALGNWLYDRDPLEPLRFEGPLATVKQRLVDNPTFLQDLIRTHLLENSHRVTVVLEPDPTLNKRLEEAEQTRLAQARAAMTPPEIQAIVENTAALKERQQTPDSPELLALLPSLQLGDLEQEIKTIPLAEEELQGTPVLLHDLFTNGIVYLDALFDYRLVPQDLLPYAQFFGKALVEMGTETEDFVKLSQRIDRTTGGVWPSSLIATRRDGPEHTAHFMLRGKATAPQTAELLAIMRDVLLTVRLDNRERFRQMVLKSKARLESSLVPAGHSYVNQRLSSAFTVAGAVNESLGGIDYLFFVRRLAQEVENDWPGVLAKLEQVRSLLVNRNALLLNVTVDDATWQTIRPHVDGFLQALPSAPVIIQPWQKPAAATDEGLAIPAQVNYVGKGADLYALGYRYHGSIHVINNYLRTSYLWDRIRAQGGAYGAFVRFSRNSGILNFLSYRDPNLLNTLANYDAAAAFLRSTDLTQDELTKSIIGAIGSMDGYQLPDAKGYTSLVRYLTGVTDAQRQEARDQVLGATLQDFRDFADVLGAVADSGRVVVMGAQETLAQANDTLDRTLEIRKVL